METLILNNMRDCENPVSKAIVFFVGDLIFMVSGLLWFQRGLPGVTTDPITAVDAVMSTAPLAFCLTIPPEVLMDVDTPLAASLMTLSWVTMPWQVWMCIWLMVTFVHRYVRLAKLPIGITWYLILALGLSIYLELSAYALVCYFVFGFYRLGKRMDLDLDLDETIATFDS
jgi:hypothetical protein